MPELSFRKLQHEAKESARRFLDDANTSEDSREAANWALAAKNAVSVALSCETILKIQNGGR
jgi:hypothetical protein